MRRAWLMFLAALAFVRRVITPSPAAMWMRGTGHFNRRPHQGTTFDVRQLVRRSRAWKDQR